MTRQIQAKKWLIGNWKQNPLCLSDAHTLATDMAQMSKALATDALHVMLAPSFVHLAAVGQALAGSSIQLAAQDVAHTNATVGAFTGDVSAGQAYDAGARFCLIGHSERRQYHHEDNALLAQKIHHARAAGLGVVFCVGESQADYEAGRTLEVLAGRLQLLESLTDVIDATNFLIAYEPVWAIGTGLVANNDEIAAAHAFIRQYVAAQLPDVAILYGGSVNETNAAKLAACREIDGVLVGGASLKVTSFEVIACAFANA